MTTFVLGLGAQKAGTTWLHRYLTAAPEFARGAMKEYHVWDAICRVDEDCPPTIAGEDTKDREALRASLIADPASYFDHFAKLLNEPGKCVTADITPAYSALLDDALNRIRSGFDALGIRTKAVFLMRDPVERCWSAARMYRERGLRIAGLDPAMPEVDYLRAYAVTAHAQRRGRYEATVTSIEEAFPRSDIFYAFYERLFEPIAVNQLSTFLEIEAQPELAAREFNVSPKKEELPEDVRAAIARFYRETLEFCSERFPITRSIWESY